MSLFGAVRLGIVARNVRRQAAASDGPLADIRPGAWAAWVAAGRADPASNGEFGAACRTDSGRAGRLVEILDGDRVSRVCLEI